MVDAKIYISFVNIDSVVHKVTWRDLAMFVELHLKLYTFIRLFIFSDVWLILRQMRNASEEFDL